MTTYYVATDGSDNGTGSASSPWRTISKAMKADLDHGDEVVVRSGTYRESVIISQDGITLRSEVPGGANIDVPSDGSLGINVNANYVRVEGFDVYGSSKSGIGGSRVHHVEIVDNYSYDNEKAGIFFRQSDYLIVEKNVVYDNARSGPSSGISILHPQNITGNRDTDEFRIIIRDNVSHDNVTKNGPHTDGNGIIIDDFRATKSDLSGYYYPSLVENNLVYRNGGEGIQVVWSDYVTVRDNTAWHNSLDSESDSTWRGELSNRQSSHNTWENNIAVADSDFNRHNTAINNISVDGYENQDVVWRDNLTFNGTYGEASVKTTGGNAMPSESKGNKLGVDPKFVDPPYDFDLRPDSPAFGGKIGASGSGRGGHQSPIVDAGKILHGDAGDNELHGGAGDDRLHGFIGRDHLSGGDGSDVLLGGKGKDELVGGDDDDVFVFSSTSHAGRGTSRDVIRDFSHAEGDKIDLRTIDANLDASGNQDFSFIGTKGFSGTPGQLRYLNGVLAGDVDGDKSADFQIEIANDHALGWGDFLF